MIIHQTLNSYVTWHTNTLCEANKIQSCKWIVSYRILNWSATYPLLELGESGGSGWKNTVLRASSTVIPSVKTRYVNRKVLRKSMLRKRKSVSLWSNLSGVAYRIWGIYKGNWRRLNIRIHFSVKGKCICIWPCKYWRFWKIWYPRHLWTD